MVIEGHEVSPAKTKLKRERRLIGWREYVRFPDLIEHDLKAKIDTGARTAALRAANISPIEINGEKWVEFTVDLTDPVHTQLCRARVIDERPIKNTSGQPEIRYIIETDMVLGDRVWHIEVSLAGRENMTFDLILGRTAVRAKNLAINPGRSFLAGPPLLDKNSVKRVVKKRKENP